MSSTPTCNPPGRQWLVSTTTPVLTAVSDSGVILQMREVDARNVRPCARLYKGVVSTTPSRLRRQDDYRCAHQVAAAQRLLQASQQAYQPPRADQVARLQGARDGP